LAPLKILVSAGEASGDAYAARLVEEVRRRFPEAQFFGCAGVKMQGVGVRAVVDARSLSVVGLVEVAGHIPRIYREYRRLADAARAERPQLAILTDSPDFHLRLARRLKKLGIPVLYLGAPQVWAWRKGRIHAIKRNIDRLLCIFPFEEAFFCRHGVRAVYIGHPLSHMVQPALSRAAFFARHQIPADRPVIALLPGSREGEIARHLPPLIDAAGRLNQSHAATCIVGTPAGFRQGVASSGSIRVSQGETWDVLAHADLALAASGTVTIEAALLGTPMVTFYKVTSWSWWLGKLLVDVPFYSMVNLVAGRAVVPELMQNEVRGDRLAQEASRLLDDSAARDEMRRGLMEVTAKLRTPEDPMERAAHIVQELLAGAEHVS
jgi:lipid-A-disaccharide synthase